MRHRLMRYNTTTTCYKELELLSQQPTKNDNAASMAVPKIIAHLNNIFFGCRFHVPHKFNFMAADRMKREIKRNQMNTVRTADWLEKTSNTSLWVPYGALIRILNWPNKTPTQLSRLNHDHFAEICFFFFVVSLSLCVAVFVFHCCLSIFFPFCFECSTWNFMTFVYMHEHLMIGCNKIERQKRTKRRNIMLKMTYSK